MRVRRLASKPASSGSISSSSTGGVFPSFVQREPDLICATRPEESRMRGVLVALIVLAAMPSVARADTVVALGDSAISGEAGRWAGNTNGDPARTDALGPTAYYDAGSGEAIPGCHRSKSAEVLLGGGVTGVNLACSGARTYTHTGDDGAFKPGLDFDPAGGQA